MGSRGPGRKLRLRRSKVHYWYDSTGLSMNAYCHAATRDYCQRPIVVESGSPQLVKVTSLLGCSQVFPVDGRKLLKSTSTNSANQGEHSMKTDSLNNRVMFIDGTSILYRSYYKLLARLHHGHLEHADGNGDWVLTIFTALSMLLNVLEFVPSHVVVVFDHDGFSFDQTTAMPFKENYVSKGQPHTYT